MDSTGAIPFFAGSFSWGPVVACAVIPALVFGLPLGLKLAGQLGVAWARRNSGTAPLGVLALLAVGLPLVLSVGAWAIVYQTLGDFDHIEAGPDALVLSHHLETVKPRVVRREDIAWTEVSREATGGRASSVFWRLRIRTREGELLRSNRGTDREELRRAIQRAGLSTARVVEE